ncbi:MAG: DUF1788 domain-containing protein [Planctomycetes bacterium]|nr:DUF1788 domain-containing protein [Planctomycetota bacterium]NOG54179.1 DUF1788 domain-containing protein [Planctomycetota bacterium]
MGHIEELANRYGSHIKVPWQRSLAGDQKSIFVVYPKAEEPRLRNRIELFEMQTASAGHQWKLLDLTGTFARWMADQEYRETYFEEPESLVMQLQNGFLQYIADRLLAVLTADDVDEDTVVAVLGVASFYGFTHVSKVMKKVIADIRGRLVVFFPGEYEDKVYRLLDARDGWNYLAVPITLHNGMYD